jgi:hypothetical protein
VQSQRKVGKPSRFTGEIGEEAVRLAAAGLTLKAIAGQIGVGERTFHEWLARGRAGDPSFSTWARRVMGSARMVRDERRSARWLREADASEERWRRFKAAQTAYRIEQLGEAVFWRNRLEWLSSRGKHRAYDRTLALIRSRNIRIFRPQ